MSQLFLGAQHSGAGREGGREGCSSIPSANTWANPTCSPAKGALLRAAADGQYWLPHMGKGKLSPSSLASR